MIITGTVNLQTCNTELLVEIAEATQIALEQRKQLIRKRFRKDGPLALTSFETRLVGIEKLGDEITQLELQYEQDEKEALDSYVNQ